ncbi:MAG: hypothetical protein V2I38_15085 [Alcanivoracaceae bacterium]|jgi:hypothetical protein|nr:hypothetical protein [Alcanivoracaceae bacterium]
MKNIIIMLSAIAMGAAGYVAGYKRGGEDLVYMDHMMVGLVSQASISYCDKHEFPERCYKWMQGLKVLHAVYYFNSSKNELSPLAKHVFPEVYDGYIKAVVDLPEMLGASDSRVPCFSLGGEDDDNSEKCQSEIKLFIRQAERYPYINNSLKSVAPENGGP